MCSTLRLAMFQVLLSGHLIPANHARPVGLFFQKGLCLTPKNTPRAPAQDAHLLRHVIPCADAQLGLGPMCHHSGAWSVCPFEHNYTHPRCYLFDSYV